MDIQNHLKFHFTKLYLTFHNLLRGGTTMTRKNANKKVVKLSSARRRSFWRRFLNSFTGNDMKYFF
jgi:hypothetical protein